MTLPFHPLFFANYPSFWWKNHVGLSALYLQHFHLGFDKEKQLSIFSGKSKRLYSSQMMRDQKLPKKIQYLMKITTEFRTRVEAWLRFLKTRPVNKPEKNHEFSFGIHFEIKYESKKNTWIKNFWFNFSFSSKWNGMQVNSTSVLSWGFITPDRKWNRISALKYQTQMLPPFAGITVYLWGWVVWTLKTMWLLESFLNVIEEDVFLVKSPLKHT